MKYSKKVISVILTALMVHSVFVAGVVTTSAYETDNVTNQVQISDSQKNYNGFTYSILNDTVIITSYIGSDTDIVIPSEIDGLPVTSIGCRAFSGCSSITSVTIPDSVTSTGNFVFSNCINLKSVTFSNSITKIENYMFYNCVGLTDITIPNSVASIEYGAFYKCENLTNVTIPNSVFRIKRSAFSGCSNLTDVYYSGSDVQWEFVDIGSHNEYLKNANIRYSYIEHYVILDETEITLGLGQTSQLTAKVKSENPETELTWASSNESVVTVNAEGEVTAQSEGTATVTVTTSQGDTAVCEITVKKAPSKLSLNKVALIVGLGEDFKFTASVAKDEYTGNVEYTSSNTDVLTIDKDGNIETKSVGTAIVKATTYNGKTATCRVTVKNAPTSISINRANSIVGLGETFYLEGKLSNDEASRSITFLSTNPCVATVNTSGIVTAKSIGTALIRIKTYNGKTATCRVTVRNAPENLYFNASNLTLTQGETFYLESKFDEGEYARTVTYNSKDKSVATISGSGVIMAKGVGVVEITGKTYNGKTATCTVTVVESDD